jgi:uncharacterized protein YbaR (Trm112 family)
MSDWVLDLIRCPITLEKLEVAPADLVERLRTSVRDGKLTNRLGTIVTDDFQSGLLNESQSWFYPVADDIPTLVPDEAIACESRVNS